MKITYRQLQLALETMTASEQRRLRANTWLNDKLDVAYSYEYHSHLNWLLRQELSRG